MKTIFRTIRLLCLALLALGAFSVSAMAETTDVADADFNDGKMHWNISADNVLTVSGTGDMPNYSSSVNAPWYSYRSQIKSIVVEGGVTGLGAYAFYQLTNAEAASLPDSVETMGNNCFSGCSSLKTIRNCR